MHNHLGRDHTMKTLNILLALAACLPLAALAQTHPLNDTGTTWSGHAIDGNAANCDAAHPARQDCRYGRDAAAMSGKLAKTGASSPDVNPADPLYGRPNGFDYTKISNSGNPLPHTAALGTGPDDWACTRDNLTGLVWEVKTTSGLRSKDHMYLWFDSTKPPGYQGTASVDHWDWYDDVYEQTGEEWADPSIRHDICEVDGRCDTEKYVADVNATHLCGASNWRMPKQRELAGIIDWGREGIGADPWFFPNIPGALVWTASIRSLNDGGYPVGVVNFGGAAVWWGPFPYQNFYGEWQRVNPVILVRN